GHLRDRRIPLHLLRDVPGGLPRGSDPRGAALRERRVRARAFRLRLGSVDGSETPVHGSVGPRRQAVRMTDLLWWVFASLAIGGGLGMILGRSPVASLLSLILTFFSLAAIYVLLGAHFIAAIQIIVYAGAIMVLFLFVIMLLNLGHDYQADLRGGLWIVVGFVAAGLLGWMAWSAIGTPGSVVQRGGEQEIAASVE